MLLVVLSQHVHLIMFAHLNDSGKWNELDYEYLEQKESKPNGVNIWSPTSNTKIIDQNPWVFHSMISLLYIVTSFTIENDLIWKGGVTKIWKRFNSFEQLIKFKDNQYIHAKV